jgi:hypothetical protein
MAGFHPHLINGSVEEIRSHERCSGRLLRKRYRIVEMRCRTFVALSVWWPACRAARVDPLIALRVD